MTSSNRSPTSVIKLTLPEGNSFRTLFEYIAATTTRLPLVFYTDRIESFQTDSQGSVISHLLILANQTVDYQFDVRYFSNPEYQSPDGSDPRHCVVLDEDALRSFVNLTRTCSKKDSVCLSIWSDDINTLHLLLRPEDPSTSAVAVITVPESNVYHFAELEQDLGNANYAISMYQFAKSFAAITKQRLKLADLHFGTRGLRVVGHGARNTDVTSITWENPDNEFAPHRAPVQLSLPLIKLFAKFDNLAVGAMVHTYNEDAMYRLSLAVGHYGRLVIFVQQLAARV